MKTTTERKFTLRKDFKDNITNPPLSNFLTKHNIQFTVISDDMIEKLEDAVQKEFISKQELCDFLDHETRFGHNRTMFLYDIAPEDLATIKHLNKERLEELLRNKGWTLPTQSLIDFYLPESLTLAEYCIDNDHTVDLTFVETINTTKSNGSSIKRENNYYFVNINPSTGSLFVRMRPRSNAVRISAGEITEKVNNVYLFYKIKNEIKRVFGITLIDSTHFKTTLYKIAKDMTEKAEEKWKDEVGKFEVEINHFAENMESKLEGINTELFDLNFRLKRLLERALIKSNFSDLKVSGPGKKGYVHMFHFSDRSGGKIKASTKEKEKAIELSEIYYDTRDTIDKSRAYDILWVYWFKDNKVLRTKLEATSEYYQIHFFSYISEDDISHVLSEVGKYKKT